MTRTRRDKTYKKRSLRHQLTAILISPICSFAGWYIFAHFLYRAQQFISDHHQTSAHVAYVVLVSLLYSSLLLAILFPLWAWWQLIGHKRLNWWHWKPLFIACLFLVPTGYFFAQEAKKEVNIRPSIISHRAVNNQNGAENTLEAFRQTVQEQPDLVEIDVYETADNEFVVYHDPTLKKAGRTEHSHDLTLAELTQLIITDPTTGKKGHVVSLDAFLEEAEKLDQRLLIDFKTTKNDSKEMVQQFLAKYQKRMETQHHQLQSFDANFMQAVLAHAPHFDTYLIASTVPETPLSDLTGYSVQLETMRDDFFMNIVQKNQSIYVWTVNDQAAISQAEYLAVDGIITDYISQTKQELDNIKIYRDYVSLFYDRLYYFHLIN